MGTQIAASSLSPSRYTGTDSQSDSPVQLPIYLKTTTYRLELYHGINIKYAFSEHDTIKTQLSLSCLFFWFVLTDEEHL